MVSPSVRVKVLPEPVTFMFVAAPDVRFSSITKEFVTSISTWPVPFIVPFWASVPASISIAAIWLPAPTLSLNVTVPLPAFIVRLFVFVPTIVLSNVIFFYAPALESKVIFAPKITAL